ncbi:MAG: DUF1993 domain-containing protein [Burkholderiales bacterium]|nr:DUF1993 domain-containing protein [Burkholderiales bacterium]
MPMSLYSQSVPAFQQMLLALQAILKQADAHATSKKIEPDALLQARLFPDMFPLIRQVQIAADFSRGVSARLGGVDVPVFEGTERTFADLDTLLEQTLEFLKGLEAAGFEGAESREIVLRPGTPKEKRLSGAAYLTHYGLPQFYFHVTTAYALLRHNGIEVGKRDFMGTY